MVTLKRENSARTAGLRENLIWESSFISDFIAELLVVRRFKQGCRTTRWLRREWMSEPESHQQLDESSEQPIEEDEQPNRVDYRSRLMAE